MKTTLKQILVLRLTLNEKPTSHNNRKLIFDRDSSLPPCIVFDDRCESPIGFGVKSSKRRRLTLYKDEFQSNRLLRQRLTMFLTFLTDTVKNNAYSLV